ncbi:hypothetical protein [Streptomyces spiralis]
MPMPLWRRRRTQSPQPVTAGDPPPARGPSGATAPRPAAPDDLPERLARDLRTAQEDTARWKRHADSYADEKDLAVKAFEAKAGEAADLARERDGAYRERAQLLAWLAALHPASTVITPAADIDEPGWQLLYLVAGGWQLSWHIAPDDARLFKHVTVVEPTDARAQWDGHGTEQKYERIRGHVRLLALDELAASRPSTTDVDVAERVAQLQADWARFRGHVLNEVWAALRDADGGPLLDAMNVVTGLLEQAQTNPTGPEARSA